MRTTVKWIVISCFALCCSAFGQTQPNAEVEKVHVIFKTHLDIGYTDFASKVEQRYIDEFIPKALALNDELKAEGSTDKYIWTTGSWLIDTYLKQASPDAVKKFETALEQGD
ncbi:MAG: DUF5054 domain-containing protein, partial [Tannerella sp.]|nr:DUF5054 domain-containing protein [Tannerella sp.]